MSKTQEVSTSEFVALAHNRYKHDSTQIWTSFGGHIYDLVEDFLSACSGRCRYARKWWRWKGPKTLERFAEFLDWLESTTEPAVSDKFVILERTAKGNLVFWPVNAPKFRR